MEISKFSFPHISNQKSSRTLPATQSKKTESDKVALNKQVHSMKNAQNAKHLQFLERAHTSLTFYESKRAEVDSFMEFASKFPPDADVHQEALDMYDATIPDIEQAVLEISENIDNEAMEHTFIMSILEEITKEDGKFPIATLEEYLAKKKEEFDPEVDEQKKQKIYKAEDIKKLISSHMRNNISIDSKA